MWVYLSENEKLKDFGGEYALVWHESNIPSIKDCDGFLFLHAKVVWLLSDS
ncbi:unnamed protein product [Musa acuminata subsp. burmannicoides]